MLINAAIHQFLSQMAKRSTLPKLERHRYPTRLTQVFLQNPYSGHWINFLEDEPALKDRGINKDSKLKLMAFWPPPAIEPTPRAA